MAFVFSADGHVVEPGDLFDKSLPAALKKYGIRSERQGEHICVLAGEKVLHRMRLSPRRAVDTPAAASAPAAAPAGGQQTNFSGLHAKPSGNDIDSRIKDMKVDGIDAEIAFPSTCLWAYGIEHAETELATAQIYNDWNNNYFKGHLDRFVRCGVLPVREFRNTELEMKRLAKLGFTAAMMPVATPTGMPKYNDEFWDPVFALGAELGIVFVMHTGTGLDTVQPERHAGGAVINYTTMASDAWNSIQYLVAGGMLDRHPTAKVAYVESGASWLAGLVERMDEIYIAHAQMVRPKLSLMPSEIVERQVSCSFQSDRACILSRSVTGVRPLIWGNDYPHAEGTWPRSRSVMQKLFDGVEISEQEKADIVGGNAARLFRLPHPDVRAAA
jgi:predicted TIM-barrel fold metal-dependent hydrolase